MKTLAKTVLYTLLGGLLIASPLSMAADLTDRYDPFVLFHDIATMPPGEIDRLADLYDPYVLYNEIVTSKVCSDPAHEMLADNYSSFITLTDLNKSKKC